MDKHLLTDIHIKDFKCFKDFKAEGFKRVNLIGGKNNVGKTAFMEACYVNLSSVDVNKAWTVLSTMKTIRDSLEFLNTTFTLEHMKNNFEIIPIFNSSSNLNIFTFNLSDESGKKEYQFTIKNKKVIVNANDFSYSVEDNKSINFINNFGLKNNNLKNVFEAVQKKDKEATLYKYINEFDERIINFKVIGGDKPQCKILDNGYRDINEFGDGLKHYISIICSLYASSDNYLFIDEIDNGIHYTQLDRLWEIILTISKEQNVQVFATTHSKECIESYARVSKKLEDENKTEKDDICFIELGRNKNNELDSIIYNYEMIQSEIEQNHEIRGW